MWRKVLIVGVLFACSMIPATGLTWESNYWPICEQESLEGTWNLVLDVTAGHGCEGYYSIYFAEVQIDAAGNILNTGATLDRPCGDWTITGGQLTFDLKCDMSGFIETSNGRLNMLRGGYLNPTSWILVTTHE